VKSFFIVKGILNLFWKICGVYRYNSKNVIVSTVHGSCWSALYPWQFTLGETVSSSPLSETEEKKMPYPCWKYRVDITQWLKFSGPFIIIFGNTNSVCIYMFYCQILFFWICNYVHHILISSAFSRLQTNKLRGLSPRANYTHRATAACRRS
jgi:hypothetical protein